jgi:hypothetical protein
LKISYCFMIFVHSLLLLRLFVAGFCFYYSFTVEGDSAKTIKGLLKVRLKCLVCSEKLFTRFMLSFLSSFGLCWLHCQFSHGWLFNWFAICLLRLILFVVHMLQRGLWSCLLDHLLNFRRLCSLYLGSTYSAILAGKGIQNV